MKRFKLIALLLLAITMGVKAQESKNIIVNKTGTLSSIISIPESNNIKSLTISGTINAIDFNYLKNNFNTLEYLNLSKASIRNYLGKKGTAGDKTQLYPNNGIPAYAFATYTDYTSSGKESLKRVILPDDIKSIGKSAFANCPNVSIVVLNTPAPPSLGDNALSPQRTAIFVKPGTKEEYIYHKDWGKFAIIDSQPFDVKITTNEQTGLAKALQECGVQPAQVNFLTIKGPMTEDDIKLIRNYMSFIVKIDLTNTDLTEIPDFTFAQKSYLLNVQLPSKLIKIGARAFEGCSKLGPIVYLPTSVKIIGEGAFENCSRLDAVSVQSNLEAVGNFVFGKESDNKFIFKN